MPCYYPISGYRSRHVNPNGKRPLVFKLSEALNSDVIEVPCGRCIGCRLEKSRQWAVRIMHEASLHDENSFLTLTYDDDHVPSDFSLDVRDYQLFMKRLRKSIYPKKVRFFHCGEYGEKFGRPHYHAILFGHNFHDRKHFKNSTSDGSPLFSSEELDNLWDQGHCLIGEVTFESAAYVARYVTKKVTGDRAEDHYQGRTPEYVTMSRRPGIGRGWLEKYSGDVYPSDEVVVRGNVCKPPRFYDKYLQDTNPELYESIIERRTQQAKKSKEHPDSSYYRLDVRNQVKEKNSKFFKRDVDGES